tara:strand:- start:80242 stop:80478 length:237 start_codon:yes stop_codon:yes gene_type:complete
MLNLLSETKKPLKLVVFLWVFNGRYERIRTSDPFTPSEVRYQAALRTDVGRIIMIPRQKAMLDALTAVIFANCRKLNG